MTLRAWLDERSPVPPERLRARIDAVLGARADEPAAQATDLCVETAGALLRDLLARPSAGRESALDLLVVDALVTYAFEAAADDIASLDERAASAMAQLSALATA